MKTILALIFSCLSLSAATLYPVLSDQSTARTLTGGTTNVATLTGTNVFIGTNTFTAANFFPANGIGVRLLWSSPTNIYLASAVTNASANLTNAGDFSSLTYLMKANLPPLLGSNSSIAVVYGAIATNTNASGLLISWLVGSNTNFIGRGTMVATSISAPSSGIGSMVFHNAGSFTSQLMGNVSSVFVGGPSNLVDTSSSWSLMAGVSTATSHLNSQVFAFRIYELYAP